MTTALPIELRIDAPGAGEWVMERAEGFFTPGRDHCISSHRGDEILGGFVLSGYLGASMTVHMAAETPDWCSREMLWMVFHYVFEQLHVTKLLAPVRSDNWRALSLDLRAGWLIEAVLRDVFAPGVHMFVLSITKEVCPWLDYTPRKWRSLEDAA